MFPINISLTLCCMYFALFLCFLVLQSHTICIVSSNYVSLFPCVFSSFGSWPPYCRQFNNTMYKVKEQQEKQKRVRKMERGGEENKTKHKGCRCSVIRETLEITSTVTTGEKQWRS